VQCNGTLEDCIPELVYTLDFLSNEITKDRLGFPQNLTYVPESDPVHTAFILSGDMQVPLPPLFICLRDANLFTLCFPGFSKQTSCTQPFWRTAFASCVSRCSALRCSSAERLIRLRRQVGCLGQLAQCRLYGMQ
jgi:hypothetical protein